MQHALKHIYAVARNNPDQPAIIISGMVITYEMLIRGILSVEKSIVDLALDQNHPIGVFVTNPAQHIIIILALAKKGYASASFLESFLSCGETIGVKDIIADRPTTASNARLHRLTDDWYSKPVDPNVWTVAYQPDQRIMRVTFTSGSSGEKKAYGLSNIVFYLRILEQGVIYRMKYDRAYCGVGLSLSAGLALSLFVLMSGGTLVFGTSSEEARKLISERSVEFVFASPAGIQQIVSDQNGSYFPSVRRLVLAGGPLTIETVARIRRSFPGEIINHYGSTEAGLTGIAMGRQLLSKSGSRFTPVQEVKILKESAADRDGRVAVRSPHMAWPFAGSMMETEAIKGDGWFCPGDLGHIDEGGFLILSGRTDEVINAGGFKLTPEQIEQVISTFPGLKDVAALRQDYGGAPQVWVAIVSEKTVSPDTITDWLHKAKVPVQVHRVVNVASIPRSEMMKVERGRLRRQLANA